MFVCRIADRELSSKKLKESHGTWQCCFDAHKILVSLVSTIRTFTEGEDTISNGDDKVPSGATIVNMDPGEPGQGRKKVIDTCWRSG